MATDQPLDSDEIETQEWLDALDAVIDREGPERAHFFTSIPFHPILKNPIPVIMNLSTDCAQ